MLRECAGSRSEGTPRMRWIGNMKECLGKRGLDFREGKEWRLSGLLYADDSVLCGESEEDLREIVENFIEVFRRRGLKVNADKSNVMSLGS